MSLLDLPLEIIHRILDFTVADSRLPQIARLRLVNQSFDREILRAYARSTGFKENADSFDSFNDHEIPISSKIDFYAKCLLYHPHAGQSPELSVAALFNFIVDSLLRHDGSTSSEECMKGLCQETLNYTMRWLRWQPDKWENCSLRDVRHHVFMAALHLEKYSVTRAILGKGVRPSEIDSELFPRSPLYAALELEQYDLIRELLDDGVDVNDCTRGWGSSAIGKAAEKGQKYVELILAPQYGCQTTGDTFENAIIHALDIGNVETADFILGHSPVPVAEMDELLYAGLPAACRAGSLKFVKLLTENIGEDRPDVKPWRKKKWRGEHFWKTRDDFQRTGVDLVTQAAWKGHEDILRFLLSKGADPCGEHGGRSVMQAITWEGHLQIADILVDAGVRLTEQEWVDVFYLVSVRQRSFNFTRWVFERGLFDMSKAKQDAKIMAKLAEFICYAAIIGNIDFIKTLAEYGFPITDTFLSEAVQSASPPIVYAKAALPTAHAKAAGQQETLRLLLDLGVPDYDPLNTPIRDAVLRGDYQAERLRVPVCRMPAFTN